MPLKNSVIPCANAAARLIQIGYAVSDLTVRDRVIINFSSENLYGTATSNLTALGAPQAGVLAQYNVLPNYAVKKLPKDSHLTDEDVSVLVATGVITWNTLFGSGNRFVAGQTVLMLSTGGVSITTHILAKAAGTVATITLSSDEKLKHVEEKWSVDYTVNYKPCPYWEKKVLKITQSQGVDFVIETGHFNYYELSCLNQYG